MMKLKKYYSETLEGNKQIVLFALDEAMAKAYFRRDNELTFLNERDKSKKAYTFPSEPTGVVEQFTGIREILKAKQFIDECIGVDYEVEKDTITIPEITVSEYMQLMAYLDSRQLW